jgi:hypothetical protein
MNAPNATVLHAACATIASPDAYDPVMVGEKDDASSYIDAMAGYANPTNEMIKEAEKVFGRDAIVATILSIGSGKLDLRQQPNSSTGLQLTTVLKRAVLDTERVHNDIQARFQDLGIYYRFNADSILPLYESIDGTTRIHTTTYIEEATTSQKMDAAVNSVQERRGVKPIKELSTLSSIYIVNYFLRMLQTQFLA